MGVSEHDLTSVTGVTWCCNVGYVSKRSRRSPASGEARRRAAAAARRPDPSPAPLDTWAIAYRRRYGEAPPAHLLQARADQIRVPVDQVDPLAPLDDVAERLAELELARAQLVARRDELVDELRSHGVPWAPIAAAARVSHVALIRRRSAAGVVDQAQPASDQPAP